MKLKNVRHQPAASYPTFDEYQTHRDAYLRRLAFGTGALLAASLATAGDAGASAVGGAPPAPNQATVTRSRGEIPAPAAVPAKADAAAGEATIVGPPPVTPAAASPVNIQGGKRAPTPPPAVEAVTPTAMPAAAPPVAPMGIIVAPTPAPPPVKADEPVNVDGRVKAPVPASDPEPPRTKGKPAEPKPVPPPLLGTPPPPAPAPEK